MKDIYLYSKSIEDLEKLRNYYLKEINNIEESNKNNQVYLVNSYLSLLLKVFEFDDFDFPIKYEVLEEVWKRNLRVLLKFSRMLLSDNNIEFNYNYEKVTYILVKYSLISKSNLLKDLKLDKQNKELWHWPIFDSPCSNKSLEITNIDLNLYIQEFINNWWNIWETLSNNIWYFSNKWRELSKEDNIDSIKNEIEEEKLDYIYNILNHYEYFFNYWFNVNEYLEEIKNLKNNKDNYKQIVLILSNIQFVSNWNIWDELINLIWEINEIKDIDFDLIEDEEEKIKLFQYLQKVNSENKSLGLIFFNNDFKWIEDSKKWIEELIYDYKWYFVWYSKDKKRTQNTLNIYSRQSKLRVVVYNNNSILYIIDKNKIINNDVLVFNINNTITKDYFDKNMKNIINDFIKNNLNKNEWNNFKLSAKSKFFIS